MTAFAQLPLVAGVELGGTKCICTLGRGPGAIDKQLTLPTSDPDTTLAAISAQLARWHADTAFAALGIGSFGPIDLDTRSPGYGAIQATSKDGWSGIAVRDRIAGALDIPIGFDTDVNVAALAELRWGAGRSAGALAYVTVGTGIGVGLTRRASEIASSRHAELGHIRIVRHAGDQRASVCPYHDDCLEGLASGPAIAAAFGSVPPGSMPLDHPQWAVTIDYLGQLCHVILCMGGVDQILFGGGVIMGNPTIVPAIEAAMRVSLNGYLHLPDAQPLIACAGLGTQAGPLGSLALAQDAAARSSVRAGAPAYPEWRVQSA